MNKITLRLDSHMLSDFQRCAQLGKFAHIEGYRPNQQSGGLDRGTHWHKLMELRNQGIMNNTPWMATLGFANTYLIENLTDKTEAPFYLRKLMEYDTKWSPTEKNLKILGTEVGFSKVLWSNDQIRFIYEGKIDLLCEIDGMKIVVDHKTQHPGFSSERYNLFPHSNQFLGYCWASKFKHVMIDYTTWSDKETDRTYRRNLHPISSEITNRWKEDTIKWYWKILSYIRFNDFSLNRAVCDGKYGICQFADICAYADNPALQQLKLNSGFTKEPRWEPWENT